MEKFPKPTPEKKQSGVDRIIGVSPSDEKSIKAYFSRLFDNQLVGEWTQEPSIEFREIFTQINKDLQTFLKAYGIEPLDIPLSRIDIIDKRKLSNEQREYFDQYDIDAFYHPKSQRIAIINEWDESGKLRFFQKVVHEMIHMQAFESWQNVKEEKEGEEYLTLTRETEKAHLNLRRGGFRIYGRDGESIYFHDIDEAITEELSMRFDWEYLSKLPLLSAEVQEREKALSALAKKNGTSLEEERRLLSEIKSTPTGNGSTRVILSGYSYNEEREDLAEICETIYQANSEKFSSPEDVFEEFAKAALSGALLPIARIIESTYGDGTFRFLAEETKFKEPNTDS